MARRDAHLSFALAVHPVASVLGSITRICKCTPTMSLALFHVTTIFCAVWQTECANALNCTVLERPRISCAIRHSQRTTPVPDTIFDITIIAGSICCKYQRRNASECCRFRATSWQQDVLRTLTRLGESAEEILLHAHRQHGYYLIQLLVHVYTKWHKNCGEIISACIARCRNARRRSIRGADPLQRRR